MAFRFTEATRLYSLFPEHDTYIEPFCGDGFVAINNNRPKIKLLNDHNKMLYLTFSVLSTKRGKSEILKNLEQYIHCSVNESMLKSSLGLVDKVSKNLLLGVMSEIKSSSSVSREREIKDDLIDRLKSVNRECLRNCVWSYDSFNNFLFSVDFKSKEEEKKSFVFCSKYFTLEDRTKRNVNELFDILSSKEWKFAISIDQKEIPFWESKGLNIERLYKVKKKETKTSYDCLATNYSLQFELF